MSVTIKLRRGTTTQWTANNPILAEGEVGIDTTLDKFKIGDGITVWSSLVFAAPTVSELNLKADLSGATFSGTVNVPTLSLTTADTATAATHYMVETGSDGIVRPKTLVNVQTEVVTNTTIQSNVVSPTETGSSGIRKTTVSASEPTGGADGDLWLVYA